MFFAHSVGVAVQRQSDYKICVPCAQLKFEKWVQTGALGNAEHYTEEVRRHGLYADSAAMGKRLEWEFD